MKTLDRLRMMNKLPIECRNREPDAPKRHVNRIADAWRHQGVGSHAGEWMPVSSAQMALEPEDRAFAAVVQGHRLSVDPVEAGIRVVAGISDEVRLHTHLARRLTAIEQTLEERVDKLVRERVEAVLTERAHGSRRVNPALQNALERLREETKHVQLPPAEEVWKTLDVLAFDYDED